MNRLLRWLLRGALGDEDAQVFQSEMEELYRHRMETRGHGAADSWRRRELRRVFLHGLAARVRGTPGRARVEERPCRQPGSGHDGLTSRGATMDSLLQDVRFAFRMLGRRPLFTVMAVVTLGLGIGATATIYGIADGVLLKKLPYRDAHRLVSIWTERLDSAGNWVTQSLYAPEYRELLTGATTLEKVALYFFAGGSLQGRGDPMNLIVGEGTAELPEVAGIRPQLGRWFRPEEVGPDRVNVAVLGDALWRERFGSDPNVVGTTVLLEQRPYTIIGVMPPEFRFRLGLFQDPQGLLSPRDNGERPVWVPAGHNYGSGWHYEREGWSFEALARLRPGVSLDAARAEIGILIRGDTPPGRLRVHLARRDRMEVVGLPAQLFLLAVPSALLLLIACVNVATLLLGESEGRRAEITVRAAIGAGTGRIVRQLITESVVLGLAGSAVGIALAVTATRVLVAFAPATSAMESVRVSLPVLVFCCSVGMLAGAGFGLVPALTLGWGRGWSLQSGGRSEARGASGRVNVLVGLEVALTVILLVGGGLFARTLLNLGAVNMGYQPENLVAFRAAIENLSRERRATLYSEMLARMEAVPGVRAATGSWAMPLLMSLWNVTVETEGRGTSGGSRLPGLNNDVVMPNYHETMGIPLLTGRYLTSEDRPGAPPAVVVSKSLADRLWPDGEVLGRRVRLARGSSSSDWHTVVGVVGDVRYGGPDSDPVPVVYRPYLQNPGLQGMRLVLTARTAVDPRGVIAQLAAAARSVYPGVLLREARIMSTMVSESATDQRYRALFVAAFGLVAVALAAAGIFGVVARAVARRSRELAIRMALGADSGVLESLVLGRTLLAGAVGCGAGLIVSLWGSRLIARFLFGVQSSDPLVYSAVILTVLLVCAVAGYLPARRILLIEPSSVLKEE